MENNNCTIAEYFTIPSKGLIYNQQVAPDIKMRSMTTIEEMKRLSPSEYAYRNLSDVIDDCIIGDVGISSYDMCIGDYQFLLYKLRTVTYGPIYSMASLCPYCGHENIIDIDLDSLPILEYTDNIMQYVEFDLLNSNNHIKIKFQTPRMLDEATIKAKEIKSKVQNNYDYTLIYTLAGMIDEIDGKKYNSFELEEIAKKLSMQDVNTIIAHAEKINLAIGVDTKIQNKCDLCGLGYTTSLKTTAEFFRPSLDL